MNASTDEERVLPNGGTRSLAATSTAATGGGPRRPVLLTWQGPGEHRLDAARLVIGDRRLRAIGRVVAGPAGDAAAYYAAYELALDDAGAVSRLSVFSTTAEEERQVTLSRSGEGIWLVEHDQQGEVAQRSEFEGALDVDVQDCALFNTLPIRRLGLHQEPLTVELPVLYVELPELTVELVKQTYRTISVTDDGAVIEYAAGDFRAELTVDRDGLVLDYPGLAHRI